MILTITVLLFIRLAGITFLVRNGVSEGFSNSDRTNITPSKHFKNVLWSLFNSEQNKTELKVKETKPFNQINPHESTWCPNAKCYNSPICSPCNRRFLFLVTTSRSGSTTLLRMFNSLPNVRLAGENYNALYEASHLATLFEKRPAFFRDEATIKKGYFMHERVNGGPYMHNAIPIGSMACVMQTFYENCLNPPHLSIKEDITSSRLSWDANEEQTKILGSKLIHIQSGDWSPAEAA